jgi:hypothetical protein
MHPLSLRAFTGIQEMLREVEGTTDKVARVVTMRCLN